MSNNSLPPVHHLPHWTRAGPLGKPGSPRRVVTSRGQPLLPAPSAIIGTRAAAAAAAKAKLANAAPCPSGADHRVASMERNIHFLQQQHKQTLDKLHGEIEYLTRKNKGAHKRDIQSRTGRVLFHITASRSPPTRRGPSHLSLHQQSPLIHTDLQYKLIMEHPRSSRKVLTHSRRDVRLPTQDQEAQAELYLEEPLQDTRPLQDQALSLGELEETPGSDTGQDTGTETRRRLITSLQPLRIHNSPPRPPRPPTLHECEVIIRQLYNANSIQSQEIIRVKALLRDIVLSKKITPENYILTKTYLVDGPRKSLEEKTFPKLGVNAVREKTFRPCQSGFILPALNQSLSSTIAERQRRTRAVQRDRFKRTVQ